LREKGKEVMGLFDDTLLSTKIVGTYYKGSEAMGLLNSMAKGAKVILEKEENNEYDKHAVQVSHIDEHYNLTCIGYVPKEVSKKVSELIDSEVITEVIYKGNKNISIYGEEESSIEDFLFM